jgi:cytochrome c oxidase cbb3-type subunit 2
MTNRNPRRGGAGLATVLWLFALALFFAPFLHDPYTMDPEGDDFARAEDDIPFDEDVAAFEGDFELPLGELIASAGEEWYGTSSERLRAEGVIDTTRLPEGRRAYELHCVGCHGVRGDGAGPAARHLSPRPRTFRRGVFKFKSTGSAARPRRADIFRTITTGLAGSSMPDFRLLSEEVRWDLVEYVRYLSVRGEFERFLLDTAWDEEELPNEEDVAELAEIVNDRWHPDNLRSIYPAAPETERNAASIERGRELFNDSTRASCFTCHGPEGRGDGPTAADYNDDWGYPIRPRDLTLGVFRAGADGADLYRTIAVGISGTPMGSFEASLSGEEIWDLVHFVQSLPENGR